MSHPRASNLFFEALNEVIDERTTTLYGIRKTCPADVGGKHLSDASNEPCSFSEEELLAGDRGGNDNKTVDPYRRIEADKAQRVELDRMPLGGYLS